MEWVFRDEEGKRRRRRVAMIIMRRSDWPELFDVKLKAPNTHVNLPEIFRYDGLVGDEDARKKKKQAMDRRFGVPSRRSARWRAAKAEAEERYRHLPRESDDQIVDLDHNPYGPTIEIDATARRGISLPEQYFRVQQRWHGIGLRKPGGEFSSLFELYEFVSFDREFRRCDSWLCDYERDPRKSDRPDPGWGTFIAARFLILDGGDVNAWHMQVKPAGAGSLHRSSKEEPAEFTRDDCVFPSLASMFRCLAEAPRQGAAG